ncbi:MAG TPA: heavy metal-binding domain-containing protein [Gaiellales bacterium]|nr:heavy metal-binding domain-containing protein [Gaiellales bacterium]
MGVSDRSTDGSGGGDGTGRDVSGLPPAALRRLTGVGLPFTSDLSVAEFAATRRLGVRPLTQVMGCCVYHVGYQWTGAGWIGVPQELQVLTAAYNEARDRAVRRLGEEVALAGGDAAVGVRVTAGRYDWSSDLIEFRAVGTAVSAPGLRTAAGPGLSNLDGVSASALVAAGHIPMGLVGATSVYYGTLELERAYQLGSIFSSARYQSFEYTEFADAWYQARNRVLHRLRRQAEELGATGIVGVVWRQESREHSFTYRPGGIGGPRGGGWPASSGWGPGSGRIQECEVPGVVYTVHALATAIGELRGAVVPPVYTMHRLDDKEP